LSDAFDPTKDDRFTFGLWTVGNPGRDPFGGPTRPTQDPCDLVHGLAECGAWGVNLHDNDLIPFDSTAAERDAIVARFKQSLADNGMVVPMATTNLFSHAAFKDGAFTANDPGVRALALQKTMAAMELGVELGASTYVFWGGREGTETDACRDPRDGIARFRDALNFLSAWCSDQGYNLRFALEAKPNEPRGDIYLATTGHMLHFISTLDDPERVGVNPEVAHEIMAGLSFTHGVAQAMEAGKLYHIDLNAQRIGRYDQDLRFGSEDMRGAFTLVRLLEGTAGGAPYTGPLHFDAHAYRTESVEGVWDFARGCMRTYKILKARARAFDADPEVIAFREATNTDDLVKIQDGYSAEAAAQIQSLEIDAEGIAEAGLGYERLDQLMMEYILGVRS
jgi:xylose isomerase